MKEIMKETKHNYNEYLSSTNWKDKRREILEKKGSVCSFCFTNKKIQIHHCRYKDVRGKSVLNRERHGILFPLCASCHRRWHMYFGHNLVLNIAKINRANELYLNGFTIDESIRFCFNGSLARILLKDLIASRENKIRTKKKILKRPVLSPNTKKLNRWDSKNGSPAY